MSRVWRVGDDGRKEEEEEEKEEEEKEEKEEEEEEKKRRRNSVSSASMTSGALHRAMSCNVILCKEVTRYVDSSATKPGTKK
uniref:Uncharacterized protein n=1 Tax=Vespula pensylvanica TaxID=30213 RepID=A0A834JJ31_VESPE|nr:hypothetical protein H0235_017905 [Vespula pensylvanica]